MNKQELIDELKKEIEVIRNNTDWEEHTETYEKGKRIGLEIGWMLAEKLDEPELPEIPQFVAETIEKYKENDDSLGELLSSVEHANIKFYHGLEKYRVDFNNSYPKIVDICATIARAWLDGYRVEKEKLYIIKFAPSIFGTPTYGSIGTQNGKKIMQSVYGSQEGIIIPNQYTRREIEEVGSEYMAFAEEVTE